MLIISTQKKRIFHGDRYDVRKNGCKSKRKFNASKLKFLYYGMTYNHPSMFVHRSIYKKCYYNVNLCALSDYEFVLSQFLTNSNVFHYIPKAYVNYRLDGISSQMKLGNSLSEGFISRKNAGLGIFSNCISLTIRLLIYFLFKLKCSHRE